MPQSILSFPWLTHRLDFTWLWQAKQEVVQNASSRLLVSKQAFIWNPVRPMPAARTSNQIVLFSNLGSTSFFNDTLTFLNKMTLWVHSCLKVSRVSQDTTINQILRSSSNSMWHLQLQRRHGKVLCKSVAAIFDVVYSASWCCAPTWTPSVHLAVQSSFQQILRVAETKAVCGTHWMCFTRIRCIERTENMKPYARVTYLCKIPQLSRH